MNTDAIRRAYLANQLTRDEANVALAVHRVNAKSFQALVSAWDLIKGLQAELKATRLHQQYPHLGRDIITDLIDHAFLTDHIDWQTATNYLMSEGRLGSVADHHVTCLETAKLHDAERAAYLDDPDHAPRYCTRCGKETPSRNLSNRAICHNCGRAAVSQAIENLISKQGPYYRNWRQGMLQAMHHLEDEMIRESRAENDLTLGDLIDHDKAPPCQGDCNDCPDQECRSRDHAYYPTDTEHKNTPWPCTACGHFNKYNARTCSICNTTYPHSD